MNLFFFSKPDQVADISEAATLSILGPDSFNSSNMSDMQVAKQDQSTALVSGNREEEVETTEETTLSEVRNFNVSNIYSKSAFYVSALIEISFFFNLKNNYSNLVNEH